MRDGTFACRKWFTLVELLVVISIISILASLLLPALSTARKTAKNAVCINDLKQHNVAIACYTDDHDGSYPLLCNPIGNSPRWYVPMSAYLENISPGPCTADNYPIKDRTTWACPTAWDHPKNGRWDATVTGPYLGGWCFSWGSHLGGYVWNRKTANYDATLGYMGRRLRSFPTPAKMPLLCDGNSFLADLYEEDNVRPSNPDTYVSYRHTGRHANVLYVDGHVDKTTHVEKWWPDW